MKDQIKLVQEFHKKFKSDIGKSPQLITQERSKLRHMLMNEEVQEYLEGTKKGDITNITKELCDILYTVYGTIVEHGLQDIIVNAFEENHKSQMTKDYTQGKMKKGKNFKEANMIQFFNKK